MAGSGRAELARLMPELETPLEAAQRDADGSGQGRLFEHLLHFLAQLGQRGPLAIVLEDIHWADRSTLELLGFLARNLRAMPVLLVATYRTDELHGRHPLPPLLAELDRSGQVERLWLARFDRHELASQLEGILGVPTRARPAVADRCPLGGQCVLCGGAACGRVPRGRAACHAARDPPRAARGAQRTDTGTPARRVGCGPADRVGSARVRHRVVGDAPGGAASRSGRQPAPCSAGPPAGARLTFRHALVQEAVYGELLPGERARLHAAFARAISDEGPAQRCLERGRARLPLAGRARPAPGVRRVDRGGHRRGGDLRLGRGQGGLRARARAVGPGPGRRCARPARPGRAPDARRVPRRRPGAVPLGRLHPGSHRAGRRRRPTRREPGCSTNGSVSTAAVALDGATALVAYQEAVRLVPADPPSAARSWVLSGLGRFYAETDRPAEAVALCEEALSVARAAGARQVETRALVPLGMSQVMLGDVETGLATLRRAREMAARPRRCPRGRQGLDLAGHALFGGTPLARRQRPQASRRRPTRRVTALAHAGLRMP